MIFFFFFHIFFFFFHISSRQSSYLEWHSPAVLSSTEEHSMLMWSHAAISSSHISALNHVSPPANLVEVGQSLGMRSVGWVGEGGLSDSDCGRETYGMSVYAGAGWKGRSGMDWLTSGEFQCCGEVSAGHIWLAYWGRIRLDYGSDVKYIMQQRMDRWRRRSALNFQLAWLQDSKGWLRRNTFTDSSWRQQGQ